MQCLHAHWPLPEAATEPVSIATEVDGKTGGAPKVVGEGAAETKKQVT